MYDGTGYPDRLKGKEIRSRRASFCLADGLRAMTSTRPYRIGLPLEFAIQEMQKMAGSQFCPNCVDAFVRILKSTAGSVPDPAAGSSPEPAPPRRKVKPGGWKRAIRSRGGRLRRRAGGRVRHGPAGRFQDPHERVDAFGAELRPGHLLHFLNGEFERQADPVRAGGGHGVEGIRQADDARRDRDSPSPSGDRDPSPSYIS